MTRTLPIFSSCCTTTRACPLDAPFLILTSFPFSFFLLLVCPEIYTFFLPFRLLPHPHIHLFTRYSVFSFYVRSFLIHPTHLSFYIISILLSSLCIVYGFHTHRTLIYTPNIDFILLLLIFMLPYYAVFLPSPNIALRIQCKHTLMHRGWCFQRTRKNKPKWRYTRPGEVHLFGVFTLSSILTRVAVSKEFNDTCLCGA